VTLRRYYPSDLTDEEWALLEPLIPAPKPGGRPAEVSRREIMNAILYVLKNGIPWRAMPRHKKSFRSLPSSKSTRLAKRLSERPRL